MANGGTDFTLAVVLLSILFPVLLAALWCGVLIMMSALGGWRRLAQTYPAPANSPAGRTFRGLTGMVGFANYRRALAVTVTDTGLLIRVSFAFKPGHPPLFIAFAEMHDFGRRTLVFRDYAAFDIGKPKIASMRLPLPLFEGTPVAAEIR